ncbi:capsid protein [Capybara virus 30_cap3_1444]|nr:capsid protein [Capybara virus 30_cap3_1444]
MFRRRGRRYRRGRRRNRMRMIARNTVLSIRAGAPRPIIDAGDAWVKRRVARFVAATNGDTGYGLVLSDLWSAITRGPSGSSIKQPWGSAASFDIRITSMRVWTTSPGKYLDVDVNEGAMCQSAPSTNPRRLSRQPILSTQRVGVAWKVPYPQQLVIPTVLSSSSTQLALLRTPSDTGAETFFVLFSIKYKV